ncbi:hypothetical protein GOEFS_055_00150 [Gordonia effusa NBRC 100432]|uniref:Maltokinase N-terminal cap domain-containing protein n=1 Tax=Gordonia effusa NBRC 100432 TaxID=1077974 RepID=H0R0A1_9ACTN|nr:hypothetical protein [Gordonia effusa]GAB18502.1 hypothetical protein GOEFS_055_00150 [Gordonia effusa NBRC 100432]
MATVHPEAVISPRKSELIAEWLPRQSWYRGPADQRFKRVGSYRFDDPEGEVGMETILTRGQIDGQIYQIPMTYRGAALASGELMTTMEHSILGPRHIYVGTTDPVFLAVITATMIDRGREAEQVIAGGDQHGVAVPSGAQVRGSGRLTESDGDVEVVMPHLIPAPLPREVVAKLEGYWTDGTGPVAWLIDAKS